MSFTRRRSPACRAPFASPWPRTRAARRPRSTCSRRRGRPGVRRFLFAASSSAYGDTPELPKHEGMLPQPLSPYAAGKLAGEHYVRVYAQTMGLDGVSLRYFNIFGPRQDPSSPYSGVISLFIKGMAEGQPADHLRRWRADPRLHLRRQCRGCQSRRDAARPAAGRRGLQRRHRASGSGCSTWSASLNTVFGTDLEPEFQPPRDRRRPRLAGQPGADQPGARLSADRLVRGGVETDGGGQPGRQRLIPRLPDHPGCDGFASKSLQDPPEVVGDRFHIGLAQNAEVRPPHGDDLDLRSELRPRQFHFEQVLERLGFRFIRTEKRGQSAYTN